MPAHFRAAAEALESRIAPAGVMVFTDVDGDIVTIKTSVGSFSADDFVTVAGSIPGVTGGVQIQKIILTHTEDNFNKTNLTISVKKGALGDGAVNIGAIDADGVDLASVLIPGDLGRITAGSGNGVGVGTLTVDSLGRAGESAQVGGDNLNSVISGNLTKLVIKGDVAGASLRVSSNVGLGNLGSLSVGGSLLGGNADNSGSIIVDGVITGSATIRGNIEGGSGVDSGQLSAALIVGKTTIGGDILGGTNTRSGTLLSANNAGAISVAGSVQGNDATDSAIQFAGGIFVSGNLASLTIGQDLKGGGGKYGGYVLVYGDLGTVNVGGDVEGGKDDFTGSIQSGGKIGNVTIRGSLLGTNGDFTGALFTGNDDIAAPVLASPGTIGTVKVSGSLLGGGGDHSGSIKADDKLGKVTVTGDVKGDTGSYSGSIQARGDLAGAAITGSVHGGSGSWSGSIFTGSPDLMSDPGVLGGAIGAVQIGGSVFGGNNANTGSIIAKTKLTSVAISGSLQGDPTESGAHSGSIVSLGSIGTVTVKGSVIGGSASQSGSILAEGGGITSVSIGRDLVSKLAPNGIYAAGNLTTVKVGGSIIGGSPTTPALILADGIANPASTAKAVAIGSVTVGARVENAQILAGTDFYSASLGGVANADAGIGTITTGGDWIASSAAAGVDPGAGGLFGDGDTVETNNASATVASRIASIVIKGNLFGTPNTMGDSFAFTAQQIGALTIHGQKQTLSATSNDDRFLGANLDVLIKELGGA